jgi:hypothetical protein
MKKVISILFVFALISCGNQDESQNNNIDSDTTIAEEEIYSDFDEEGDVSYSLPSPLQIAFLFKNSGLKYQAGITHEPSKAKNYNTKVAQMLNLGVYSADMAYNVLHNQTQEAINYLKVMNDLSEKLWMTDVFNNNNLRERFEKNIGNADSLAYIIADMQMELDNYLEENELEDASVVVFAGAWIESMYLASQTSDLTDNLKLNVKLSEQTIILESLINLLKHKHPQGVEELINGLTDLQTVLKPLQDESEDIPSLSAEELNLLKEKIETLRTKITA